MFLLGMLRVVAVFPALAMEQTIFLPESIPGDLEEHPELLRHGQLQSLRHRRLQRRAELSGSLGICHILLTGSLGGAENLRVLDLKIKKKKGIFVFPFLCSSLSLSCTLSLQMDSGNEAFPQVLVHFVHRAQQTRLTPARHRWGDFQQNSLIFTAHRLAQSPNPGFRRARTCPGLASRSGETSAKLRLMTGLVLS